VTGEDKVKKLRAILSKYREAYITVGVHAGAGDYQSGVDVAEVALWQEFGTKTIPARSFLGSTIDEQQSKIDGWREYAIDQIISGKQDIDWALDYMGQNIVNLVTNKISSSVPPPYGTGKGSTVTENEIASRQAAKAARTGGSYATLVDTGLLKRSVAYKKVLK
jgi:hypothetical protein